VEQRSVRRGWTIAFAMLSVFALAGAAMSRARAPGINGTRDEPATLGGKAERIRIQVLNGTKVRGLARRATLLLRDRGFDVVEMGTVTRARDTTDVVDLSGHPDWARRVADVLEKRGPVRVIARRDSSRYLDVAVVLGAAWRAPSEPFYP
jgi:LytR cell envelope-related transcriptional attenuator